MITIANVKYKPIKKEKKITKTNKKETKQQHKNVNVYPTMRCNTIRNTADAA